MNVVLYRTNDDPRTLNKTLTQIISRNCVLKDESELVNPVITFKISSATQINYAYISALNRYYFVERAEYGINGLITLYLRCDVLMSFKDAIKALTGTVSRSENHKNGYLIDDRYNAYSYKQVTTKRFPNAMENDSIILITVG